MINKRFTIPRSSIYARHLWGRAGTLTKEEPYTDIGIELKEYQRSTKRYWLQFDKPLPEKDEFGHSSPLAGWEGVWIPEKLITEAGAING